MGAAATPSSAAAAPPPTTAAGLSAAEARRRLAAVGPNRIRREAATPGWRRLLAQVASPLVWLLLAACVASALLGEAADAIAIAVIVVVNATVGFLQESRAERALLALRAMTSPRAVVRRDGGTRQVPAAEVVPGDLLLLEGGDLVAADARLVEAHALTTSEAALTGESAPVEKKAEPSAPDAPLGERRDRVFMGTAVATGTGLAEVTATGMGTELGRIAHLIATATDEQTPLQRRLARVGRVLMLACLGIVALTAGLGLARSLPLFEVFMGAVSLAVAAVPEGLPAIVTITLAIGVQRMAARNVLVRRLPAVETLGSASVICTDKTGTLTTGVMVVREVWPAGDAEARVIDAAAACCDAELAAGGQPGAGTGDPTELAILAAALERDVRKQEIEAARPRRAERPFDADRRRMSVLRADGILYVKGAFESVAPLCRSGVEGTGAAEAAVEMAGRGLRVLAVAIGEGRSGAGDGEERDLALLGLVGIADPPRPEAIDAVAAARAAGIRTIMITGDHPATARAIAREMGIDVDTVHARATPEDKIRTVRRLKAEGQTVAMTGDGVNDAPALREAHVGIAMGKTGTEVSREAADMVLADDNFASIVAAVREGRGIFDNIRKTLVYLLAGNMGELLVMLGAAVVGLPLPLLPLHLLWINLASDGLPALALAMDPPTGDVMSRPPRPPGEPMLGRREWLAVVLMGALEGSLVLGVFAWAVRTHDLAWARGVAFTTVVFCELFRSFAARSRTRVLWEVGVFTNPRLVIVVVVSVLVQIALFEIPATERLFQIRALTPAECGFLLLIGLIPVSVIELAKLVRRAARRAPVSAAARS